VASLVSLVAATAGALTVAGCSSPTDALEVTDPDIINPADVQSAAGAAAARSGALRNLNHATSGILGGNTVASASGATSEGFFLLGGLFADEWINGDSFIARQEIDQRVITVQNSFLTDANRWAHRARLSAQLAVGLLAEFAPTAPAWQRAEMYYVQAYVENILAEHYCDGLVFSTVVDGEEAFGTPVTTIAAFERALAHADSGLATVTGTTADDARVRNALQVARGRILLNLNRPADAATAVAGVPTAFRYEMLHSQTTNDNAIWSLNNLNRRYSVSGGEGTNGLNFATANDPRVPVCRGGDVACRAAGVTQPGRDDLTQPVFVQLLWPARDSRVAITSGVEARLIEAEAQLRASNPGGSLATLNALRTATGAASGGVAGLTPLADAATAAGRVDQLFRERAFWLFSRGYRVGDMRRLIRQYSRPANTVFPTGAWHKGGNYGTDVTLPVPQSEENNPNVTSGQTCINRNA
jgi:hypothetical protein